MITKSSPSTSMARHLALASLTAFLVWPAANAQTMHSGMGATKPGMAASAPTDSPTMMDSGHMDMKGMMGNMSEKMASMPTSGNPDVDFAAMMRIHHIGALDMANVELRDGKNAQMRSMAKSIIAAQKKEIAQFDKFLAAQGHPVDKTPASK